MPQVLRFVVFALDERRYALPLEMVTRVVRAVAITKLPKAPRVVMGVINVQDDIMPVFDLRALNALSDRDLQLSDQFILVRTGLNGNARQIALWVDAVQGVLSCAKEDIMPANELFEGVEFLVGVVKREGEIVMIQDLDQMLGLVEPASLQLNPENSSPEDGNA